MAVKNVSITKPRDVYNALFGGDLWHRAFASMPSVPAYYLHYMLGNQQPLPLHRGLRNEVRSIIRNDSSPDSNEQIFSPYPEVTADRRSINVNAINPIYSGRPLIHTFADLDNPFLALGAFSGTPVNDSTWQIHDSYNFYTDDAQSKLVARSRQNNPLNWIAPLIVGRPDEYLLSLAQHIRPNKPFSIDDTLQTYRKR